MRAFLIVLILLISEGASAKRFTFGDKESIGFLEPTSIVNKKGEALFLGYKTTQVNFFLPIYTKDDGYILGTMSNHSQTYYLLSNYHDKLKRWQDNGQLPKVLPRYHVQVLSTALIILVIVIMLLYLVPILLKYVKNKNKKGERFVKFILGMGALAVAGYVAYDAIPSGAKKQRLISAIEQSNACAVKHNLSSPTCIEKTAPSVLIKKMGNLKETMLHLKEQLEQREVKAIDKKLDKNFTVKRSKIFENVYTSIGNATLTYTQRGKMNKSNNRFFAISVDNGKSWKISGLGDKFILDTLSSAYPFVEDLKTIRRK